MEDQLEILTTSDLFDLSSLEDSLEDIEQIFDLQKALERQILSMMREFDKASSEGFRSVMNLYTKKIKSDDGSICCDWCGTRYERVEKIRRDGFARFGWKGCCGRISMYLDNSFTLSFAYGSKYDGGAVDIKPTKGQGRFKLLRIDDCVCDKCYRENFPAIKKVNKIKKELLVQNEEKLKASKIFSCSDCFD